MTCRHALKWEPTLRLTADDVSVEIDEGTRGGRSWRPAVVGLVLAGVLLVVALFFLRAELRTRCPDGQVGGPSCDASGPVEVAPGGPPDPYESCKRTSLSALARQLSTPLDPDAVALAWARRNSNRNPSVRQEAIEACRQGLVAG